MATSLEYYMALPWSRSAPLEVDGGWVVTIGELPDFEAFSETLDDLDRHYSDALRAMLRSYLEVGHVVPTPAMVTNDPVTATWSAAAHETVLLAANLEQVFADYAEAA